MSVGFGWNIQLKLFAISYLLFVVQILKISCKKNKVVLFNISSTQMSAHYISEIVNPKNDSIYYTALLLIMNKSDKNMIKKH